MKDKTKTVMKLFYVLIAIFILVVLSISPVSALISIPLSLVLPDEWVGMLNLFVLLGLGGAFMILGFVVAIRARKQVENKKLRKFLILAGFSAGLFLILTVLHNIFYAVAETFNENTIIKGVMQVLEVVSLLGSVCVVPIVFLIGAIGSIVVYKSSKK